MRAIALVVVLLMGLPACGESDEGESTPSPQTAGGSINVTFSGVIDGSPTKLVKTDCKVAAHQTAGHPYGMSLWTILAGKQYELALVINAWSGPVSLTLPRSGTGNLVLFQVKEENGRLFLSDTRTSGSIVQGNDLMSGSYDLHGLSTMGRNQLLDVKAVYTCT